MTRLLSGWRLALRMAWREVRRARARSLLVLVMVTLPVVAVVAADVAQATSSVSSVEGLGRRIGSAEAKVQAMPGGRVYQTADPDSGGFGMRPGHDPPASLAQVEQALGGSRPAVELREGLVRLRTDLGVLSVDSTAVDLQSPLATGLYRLTSGRWPSGAHEVAMNAALSAHGYAVGDTLTETDGSTVRVVGTAESTGTRTSALLVGDTDWLPAPPARGVRTWLVGGPPVTWAQVLAVNRLGASVLSRAVVEHPPSADQLPAQFRADSGGDTTLIAILALIGVMALLEVVLLAGPAFAVGARRQSRSLALIAANGGTPAQSRRVVLGSAVVIGLISAVLGIVLGIAAAAGVVPLLQRSADSWFGPFQVRWDHVVAIAAFGVLSAFLAAVVPAWLASRQDVVAVLAGRRGDRRPSRRSPFVGLALLAGGIVLAVLGSRGSGEMLLAGSALLSVFGMLFLVPVAVVAVARLGRGLPLPLRYAVRDAARHRTRTVPAVAAVAATVAGAVALSIGNTSDQAQAKAEYSQVLAEGEGVVSFVPERQQPQVRRILAQQLPQVEVSEIEGAGAPGHGATPLRFVVPGRPDFSYGYAGMFSSGVLVGSEGLSFAHLPTSAWPRARAILDRGGAVVMTNEPVSATSVRVIGHTPRGRTTVEVPAMFVDFGSSASAPMLAVVSPRLADRFGLQVRSVGLHLHGSYITSAQQERLAEALGPLSQRIQLYVEHGYQVDGAEKVVLWILFGLAGVLMLGGTLTATFLALSDARPDLATLSAVGASPRMRRAVAAAYAVSVGMIGAVLGAGVGFIPGIAVSYPLTRPYNTGDPGPSHYLSVPWLEIVGLVVLLPVVTALIVGLLARSRLPLVARLD